MYQKDPTSDVQEGADSVQLAAVAELVDAAEEPADVDESVDLAEFIEEPTETAEGFVEVAEQCADPVEEPVDFAESTDVAEEPNRTIEEPADLAEEPDNAAEELAHAVKSTHSAETAEYAKAASGTGPATTPEDAGDIEPFKVAGAARTADFVKSAAVSESGEDIENAGLLETPEFEDVAGQL